MHWPRHRDYPIIRRADNQMVTVTYILIDLYFGGLKIPADYQSHLNFKRFNWSVHKQILSPFLLDNSIVIEIILNLFCLWSKVSPPPAPQYNGRNCSGAAIVEQGDTCFERNCPSKHWGFVVILSVVKLLLSWTQPPCSVTTCLSY